MFFPTQKTPEWDSGDASRLRELLASDTFQKAMVLVGENAPALLDGADVNKTLVASGEVRGFNYAFDTLFRLTFEQPKPELSSETYPDLEDDSKWVEGAAENKPTK